MKFLVRWSVPAAALLLFFLVAASPSRAALLVVDRLTNSVYRYSNSGSFLNKVLTDNVNVSAPSGITLSPDNSKLYITSSQNNRVVRYDYNAGAGTATNPTVFADQTDGLNFPNGVRFSPNGSKIYVSNLGGTGVAQFNGDGSSAGAPLNGNIGGGAFFQFAGMAFAPSGELLVSAFQNFPAGNQGAVAKSNAAVTSLSDFVAPSAAINGASGLLVEGFNLYVAGLFSGNIQRFNVSTGVMDAAFDISGLAFPQDLIRAPDGNGFLAGILGFSNGTGNISRYDFSGTKLGTFALPGGGGFTEPTAFATVVPEPAAIDLMGLALAALGAAARQRRAD